jgi:hypothetical protein
VLLDFERVGLSSREAFGVLVGAFEFASTASLAANGRVLPWAAGGGRAGTRAAGGRAGAALVLFHPPSVLEEWVAADLG